MALVVTLTVALPWLVPPPPVQVSMKLVSAISGPTSWLPEVGCKPLQPLEAVQEVAFVATHVSVESVPDGTELGVALTLTTGVGDATRVTVTVLAAVPPAPVQVSV